MEQAIPALLATMALIVGVLTTFRAANDSADHLAASWKDMTTFTDDRMRTDLDPVAASVSPDGRTVALTVANSGQTMITFYQRIDVIIEYTAVGGARTVEHLEFNPGGMGRGEWMVSSIQPDSVNPGLFDPGERMLQSLRVSAEIQSGAVNQVVVVAPNGAKMSTQFTR